MLRGIFNYLGLQIGWFACALGAARGVPWAGPLVVIAYLALHLLWSSNRERELRFIVIVGILGMAVDSLKQASGLINYAGNFPPASWLAPLWITGMWVLFATTLNGSLAWLQNRYVLAAFLGAIFGPLSYVSGARLGAISFNYNMSLTIGVLVIVWGSAVPFLAWLAKHMPGNTQKSPT